VTPVTGLGNLVALDSFDIEARWLKGRIERNNEVIEEPGLAQEILRKIPANILSGTPRLRKGNDL